MVLRERVAVADVRTLHSVQQHVHAADTQHRVVEVEAVEHAMMKMLTQFGVVQQIQVSLTQILAGRHQKASRAAGWIADDVGRCRRSQLDHQPDDVTWGTELAVLSGGGDLSQHVFVDIALGITLLHRYLIEQIHHLCQ